MTEVRSPADTQPGAPSAGSLLRAARQAHGMHIAVLATHLKVTPRKLEALEDDRYGDLQGATFVRALAQAACRVLKIDPAPVLSLLPPPERLSLEVAGGGLNEPFREHGARREPLFELDGRGRGVLTIVALLVTAAALLWWLPDWPTMRAWMPGAASAAAPSASEVLPSGAGPVSEPVTAPAMPAGELTAQSPVAAAAASAPTPVAAAASALEPSAVATAPAAPSLVPAHLLQVRAHTESWVEVVDGAGQPLISRTLQPGENVDIDGALPLRVKIGNASGTQLRFRGQPLDLAGVTRDNVARIELK